MQSRSPVVQGPQSNARCALTDQFVFCSLACLLSGSCAKGKGSTTPDADKLAKVIEIPLNRHRHSTPAVLRSCCHGVLRRVFPCFPAINPCTILANPYKQPVSSRCNLTRSRPTIFANTKHQRFSPPSNPQTPGAISFPVLCCMMMPC